MLDFLMLQSSQSGSRAYIGISIVVFGLALVLLWLGTKWFRRSKSTDASCEVKVAPSVGRETPSAASSVDSEVNLSKILAPTRQALFGKLKHLFSDSSKSPAYEEVEELLYSSDLGPKTVQKILDSIEVRLAKRDFQNLESLKQALVEEITEMISEAHPQSPDKNLLKIEETPTVWLVVGVNGAGKTTTIGKLASWANRKGKKVLVAAGDTFRAAAASQLAVWSQRAQVDIFESEGKPSGVAFDAVQRALKENFNLVIIDTAGRLHTQVNLMEELKKIKRVIEKALPGAPHEVLLILDANNGQNALIQARQFHEALGVTGVILTKLDGTAKGGIVVGLAHELKLPVRALGVGEKMEDLKSFDAKEFIENLTH